MSHCQIGVCVESDIMLSNLMFSTLPLSLMLLLLCCWCAIVVVCSFCVQIYDDKYFHSWVVELELIETPKLLRAVIFSCFFSLPLSPCMCRFSHSEQLVIQSSDQLRRKLKDKNSYRNKNVYSHCIYRTSIYVRNSRNSLDSIDTIWYQLHNKLFFLPIRDRRRREEMKLKSVKNGKSNITNAWTWLVL